MPPIVALTPAQFKEALTESYLDGVEGMAYALLGDAPPDDARHVSYDGPVPAELIDWLTGVRARAQGVRATELRGV